MTPTIWVRLFSKVSVHPCGCWIWTGARNADGYGVIRVGGRGSSPALAHRTAFELLVGPIPDGRELDHVCRVRACVNPTPRHLETVDHRTNIVRGFAARMRRNVRRGTARRRAREEQPA